MHYIIVYYMYYILPASVLTYGHENWTMDKSLIVAFKYRCHRKSTNVKNQLERQSDKVNNTEVLSRIVVKEPQCYKNAKD